MAKLPVPLTLEKGNVNTPLAYSTDINRSETDDTTVDNALTDVESRITQNETDISANTTNITANAENINQLQNQHPTTAPSPPYDASARRFFGGVYSERNDDSVMTELSRGINKYFSHFGDNSVISSSNTDGYIISNGVTWDGLSQHVTGFDSPTDSGNEGTGLWGKVRIEITNFNTATTYTILGAYHTDNLPYPLFQIDRGNLNYNTNGSRDNQDWQPVSDAEHGNITFVNGEAVNVVIEYHIHDNGPERSSTFRRNIECVVATHQGSITTRDNDVYIFNNDLTLTALEGEIETNRKFEVWQGGGYLRHYTEGLLLDHTDERLLGLLQYTTHNTDYANFSEPVNVPELWINGTKFDANSIRTYYKGRFTLSRIRAGYTFKRGDEFIYTEDTDNPLRVRVLSDFTSDASTQAPSTTRNATSGDFQTLGRVYHHSITQFEDVADTLNPYQILRTDSSGNVTQDAGSESFHRIRGRRAGSTRDDLAAPSEFGITGGGSGGGTQGPRGYQGRSTLRIFHLAGHGTVAPSAPSSAGVTYNPSTNTYTGLDSTWGPELSSSYNPGIHDVYTAEILYDPSLNSGAGGLVGDFVNVIRADADVGAQGPRGLPGADSTVPGPAGRDGRDGADSTVPGPAGPPGRDGVDGQDSTVPGPAGSPGADGKTILNGVADPASNLGSDGDFYINTTSNEIFGPKTAGVWGSGTSLIGPEGQPGSGGSFDEAADYQPTGNWDFQGELTKNSSNVVTEDTLPSVTFQKAFWDGGGDLRDSRYSTPAANVATANSGASPTNTFVADTGSYTSGVSIVNGVLRDVRTTTRKVIIPNWTAEANVDFSLAHLSCTFQHNVGSYQVAFFYGQDQQYRNGTGTDIMRDLTGIDTGILFGIWSGGSAGASKTMWCVNAKTGQYLQFPGSATNLSNRSNLSWSTNGTFTEIIPSAQSTASGLTEAYNFGSPNKFEVYQIKSRLIVRLNGMTLIDGFLPETEAVAHDLSGRNFGLVMTRVTSGSSTNEVHQVIVEDISSNLVLNDDNSASTFLDLTDTPSAFTGENYYRANAGATALEARSPAHVLQDIGAQAALTTTGKQDGRVFTATGTGPNDHAWEEIGDGYMDLGTPVHSANYNVTTVLQFVTAATPWIIPADQTVMIEIREQSARSQIILNTNTIRALPASTVGGSRSIGNAIQIEGQQSGSTNNRRFYIARTSSYQLLFTSLHTDSTNEAMPLTVYRPTFSGVVMDAGNSTPTPSNNLVTNPGVGGNSFALPADFNTTHNLLSIIYMNTTTADHVRHVTLPLGYINTITTGTQTIRLQGSETMTYTASTRTFSNGSGPTFQFAQII